MLTAFRRRRLIRSIQDGIEDTRNRYASRILSTEPGPDRDRAERALAREIREQTIQLEAALSRFLEDKASHLCLTIPDDDDYWGGYVEVPVKYGESRKGFLSKEGRLRVKKLIREEQRKNIEWWVKIIAPLLAALTSILGLIVALVTVLRK